VSATDGKSSSTVTADDDDDDDNNNSNSSSNRFQYSSHCEGQRKEYLRIILHIMRQVGHVARMGYMRNVYKILDGKCEGKRALGILKCRWEDNI